MLLSTGMFALSYLTRKHKSTSCAGRRRAAIGADPLEVLLTSCRLAVPVTMSLFRRRARSRGLGAVASCGSSRT